MALINCPECGKEVSDKASACIGCGAPLAEVPKTQNQLMPWNGYPVKCRDGISLSIKNKMLVITKRNKEELISLSNIQSFALNPPNMMNYGKITINTAQSPSAYISGNGKGLVGKIVGFGTPSGMTRAIGAERTFFLKFRQYQYAEELRNYILRYSNSF